MLATILAADVRRLFPPHPARTRRDDWFGCGRRAATSSTRTSPSAAGRSSGGVASVPRRYASCRSLLYRELRLWTVKPISRSIRNGGFGAHSGPSQGVPCRRAIRPLRRPWPRSAMSACARKRPFRATSANPNRPSQWWTGSGPDFGLSTLAVAFGKVAETSGRRPLH